MPDVRLHWCRHILVSLSFDRLSSMKCSPFLHNPWPCGKITIAASLRYVYSDRALASMENPGRHFVDTASSYRITFKKMICPVASEDAKTLLVGSQTDPKHCHCRPGLLSDRANEERRMRRIRITYGMEESIVADDRNEKATYARRPRRGSTKSRARHDAFPCPLLPMSLDTLPTGPSRFMHRDARGDHLSALADARVRLVLECSFPTNCFPLTSTIRDDSRQAEDSELYTATLYWTSQRRQIEASLAPPRVVPLPSEDDSSRHLGSI
nr:hypothetical protein CFP56_09489 [Quercus suber]